MNNHNQPWGQPSNENDPEPPKKSLKPFIITVIAVVAVITLIAWVLGDNLTSGQSASLMYDFLLLALIGAGLIGHVIGNPGQALRNIAGWIIIFGILGLGYSVWNGSGMLSSELNPSNGMAIENAITFRADNNGHYRVNAEINGEKVDFMIDTGATSVVLTMDDAEKIGFNLEDLTFVAPASTANGVVYNAPIRLNALSVGPIRVESVEGFVNQGELDISLLGMSFLNRLSGYEVKNGLLTLYP